MKLNLLDINQFIERGKAAEVTSTRIYSGGGRDTIDPKGQFSEDIFGRLGSQQRKRQFGYVNLHCSVIHPEAYPILTCLDPSLTKLILGKEKYIIDNAGLLLNNDEGDTGLLFFINNFNKINFDAFNKKKPQEVSFVLKNKEKIIISKYLILPAGVRDLQVNRTSGKTVIALSEIATLYERLIRQCYTIPGDISLLDPELATVMIEKIQRSVIEINNWIKDRMRGKLGLIRGSMLKKVTDFSGRLVITPDPKLQLGYVGIPWHVILKLYEPFALNYLLYKDRNGLPLIQMYLLTDHELDTNDVKRFISKVNDDPTSVNKQLEKYLAFVAQEITRDKVMLYKRDPASNRDNYISAYIRVDSSGHTMRINPYDCVKHTGDFY